MNSNEINNHRQHLGLWNKKIDEFASGISGIQDIIWDKKEIILQQLHEIRQLASDLNVDNIQLRKMILESFADIGVSESWLRKLLSETLKLSKHIRKDYLKLQQQRDQQPLQQQTQQQQRELIELPKSLSSRHSVSEQQPQDEETFAALGYLLFYKDAPIKVTVNVKTKSIEAMEIAQEILHNAKTH